MASMSLVEFLGRGSARTLEFAQVPFNEPLVVLFSSGTTGNPKVIVHSHGVSRENRKIPRYSYLLFCHRALLSMARRKIFSIAALVRTMFIFIIRMYVYFAVLDIFMFLAGRD